MAIRIAIILNNEIEGYSPVDREDIPWIDDSFEADRNGSRQSLRAPTYTRSSDEIDLVTLRDYRWLQYANTSK